MTPGGQGQLSREILLALWKIHILYHAGEGPVVGRWMLEELRSHGYRISPGTLYPLLSRMEKNGWLSSLVKGRGPKGRRDYHLTASGREVLCVVRAFIDELHEELHEEPGHSGHSD